VLTGGNGNDRFTWNAVSQSSDSEQDLVTDFENGLDRFVLTGIGVGAFANLTISYVSAGNYTLVDHNASLFSFRITGNVVASLDSTDFTF
jgi:Ca2+-binding RTX toxin-like protein